MSELRVDDIVDKEGLSAPGFSKGIVATGIVTASGGVVGNVTGDVTGTLTGTASGLAGSPDITVGDVGSTNETVSKQLTSEHANVTGMGTAGIGTFTTSVVVGSAVTANADGVIVGGAVTATSLVYGSTDVSTELATKATTGKAIAMAMVFG